MATVALVSRPASVLPKVSSSLSPAIAAAASAGQQRKLHYAIIPQGKGGRSSASGIAATVFGATGYLGRYVVNRLGRIGSQVVVPYRCDPYYIMFMKPMADLGQFFFMEWDPRNKDTIMKAIEHSNVVINLVGKEYETRNFGFDEVYVDIPQRIAKATKEAGIKKLIHVSHLNADIRSSSKYLRSKAVGEHAVREEFPDAVILKPSDMFGKEDNFLNYFAGERHWFGDTVPMIDLGKKTVKEPVYVSLSHWVFNFILSIYFPDHYLLHDLVEYIYGVIYRPFNPYSIPRPLYHLLARTFAMNPYKAWTSPEKVDRLHLTDMKHPGLPGLEDLGITPSSLGQRAAEIMRRHHRHLHKEAVLEPPLPPKILSV
uniref:NADH dehydrogenase [ubiquinone] 1 alpha subcomplex subunit 9, mitochondrial n=1 Tax=Cynoglossus semilaevis TaxID=244447 RepID=A0A3P8W535_CYNSE